MKTYKKVLLRRDYNFKGQYWSKSGKGKSFCELVLIFDLKEGLRFTASVPNMSSCDRNPLKALMKVLEHENVKGEKYEDLKYNIRRKGLHKSL